MNHGYSRDAYFDNLRFVLIFLVVAGHFLLPLDKTRFSNNIFYLIYSFHMPCFIFVSGYFSKSVIRDGRFRTGKLFQLLWLYLVFKVLVHVTEGMVEGHIGFYIDFFTESGAPWYLLSLALWYVTLPVVRELKPGAVMVGSLILGLLAGYENSVGSFLAMDRTIAFAPFFYAGYYVNQDIKERFVRTKARIPFLAAGALIAGFLFLCTYDLLMPYIQVVYGIKYARFGENLYPYGALIRGLWYLAASLLSLGLMATISDKKGIFTIIGSRTLQIYILHRVIRDLFQYFGFYNIVQVSSKLWILSLLALSFLLTAALGNSWLEKVFSWLRSLPFSYCRRHFNKTIS